LAFGCLAIALFLLLFGFVGDKSELVDASVLLRGELGA
jgi:hypothetical protein